MWATIGRTLGVTGVRAAAGAPAATAAPRALVSALASCSTVLGTPTVLSPTAIRAAVARGLVVRRAYAAAASSRSRKPAAKKSTAAAKKSTAAPKKTTAKKTTAKKATAKKTAAKKTTARKAPAKRAAAKKTPARKTAGRVKVRAKKQPTPEQRARARAKEARAREVRQKRAAKQREVRQKRVVRQREVRQRRVAKQRELRQKRLVRQRELRQKQLVREREARKTERKKQLYRKLREAALLEGPHLLPEHPFIIYFGEMRSTLEANEGTKGRTIAREAGKRYKELSEGEKNRLSALGAKNAATNALTYKRWVESHPPATIARANIARRMLKSKFPGQIMLAKLIKRPIEDERAPPKPRSSYIHYVMSRHQNKTIPAAPKDTPGRLILADQSKALGKDWKALSPTERKSFQDMAAAEQLQWKTFTKDMTTRTVAKDLAI